MRTASACTRSSRLNGERCRDAPATIVNVPVLLSRPSVGRSPPPPPAGPAGRALVVAGPTRSESPTRSRPPVAGQMAPRGTGQSASPTAQTALVHWQRSQVLARHTPPPVKRTAPAAAAATGPPQPIPAPARRAATSSGLARPRRARSSRSPRGSRQWPPPTSPGSSFSPAAPGGCTRRSSYRQYTPAQRTPEPLPEQSAKSEQKHDGRTVQPPAVPKKVRRANI